MRNLLLLCLVLTSSLCYSQVEVYVLDVGAGLCTVSKLPNGEIIVYDCGSSESSKEGNNEIEKRLPEILKTNSDIDLLVLSHTDGDHINSTGFLFDNYDIKKVLWTSYSKQKCYNGKKDNTEAFKTLVSKIKNEKCEVVDLFERDSIIPPGLEESYGDVIIRYMSGFNKPLEQWNFFNKCSKALNAISITMQLEYKGKKIFYGGDAVGWIDNTLAATEKYILENISDIRLLKSEIMIVSHHGSSNGSSPDLIEAINPDYAIFSAGTKYKHPSNSVIKRIIKNKSSTKLLGTNKNDKYKDYKKYNKDKIGDDEIKIIISENSNLICNYLNIQ